MLSLVNQQCILTGGLSAISKGNLVCLTYNHVLKGSSQHSIHGRNSKLSHTDFKPHAGIFMFSGRHLQGKCMLKWSYEPRKKLPCIVAATEDGAYDSLVDSKESEDGKGPALKYGELSDCNDVKALQAALLAAEARAATAERGKAEALEAVAKAEAKQQEYARSFVQNTELAMQELESAKVAFNRELEKIVSEKLAAQSELVLAKQDAIDLALRVEALAESAIHEATSRVAEEAALEIAAAETSAAEASAKVEERIRSASIDAADIMIKENRDAIEKSFISLQEAKDKAHKAEVALFQKMQILDDLVLKEASALGLQQAVSTLQRQLQATNNENERLQVELKAIITRAEAAEARANASDLALLQFQESANTSAQEHEEKAKSAVEALKNAGTARLEAVRAAFKADIDVLQEAVNTVHSANKAQEQANLRRLHAFERSLIAAEANAKAWKDRALAVESLLSKIREQGLESIEVAGTFDDTLDTGRMDMFLGGESRKRDLLANGPRRETPDWMVRRIKAALQGLPPRKVYRIEEKEVYIQLPKPEDAWSISAAKVKEDLFTKQVDEKEAIDKQRAALERALQRKTVRKLPEFQPKPEPGTGSGHEIVLQGFNWESWRRKWYQELIPKAADLANCGITAIWFPPPTQSVSPQGYMPGDLYDLNSAYGSVEELKSCIEEMHDRELLVLGDAVLNHRCAQKQSPNGIWNIYGGKLAWGPEAIVRDDPNFQGRGSPSSGDFFHGAPNIDHSQDFVRRDIKEWLKWLRTEIGFDGWRLDFVRGFWGGYVKEYIEASSPAFAIGEYWDSLAYEGGNICYNQDAHRQRIVNWINATGGTSSAFDVTTKGILHAALHNEYWRLIDPQGKPPGVMGWWPSRAVTFLENHDTGSTQGHWPFPRNKLMQGYAYILTHPGTPVIFYDHFYDFGLRDRITELISLRTRTGVHCRSPVKIYQASNEFYAAQIGDYLVMKLGPSDWNPSKQNNLVGNWQKVLDRGGDYQVWEKK